MNALLAAVLLSLLSAVCYASAAIVQERIATTTSPSRYGLLRSGRWWSAATLQGSGALLHVAALGLGPLSVVQPLGVLTLVLAAPMAALLVKRPVPAAAWRGIGLVSAGLAAILALTGSGASRSLDQGEQLELAGVVLGAIGVLTGTGAALRGRAALVRSVALATAAGIAYGAASVFVKTVAEGWALSTASTAVPVVVLVGVLAATGLAASQASYRGGGLATPLATMTVINPVVAASVGVIMLGEGFRHGLPGTVAVVAASAVATWGLFSLAAQAAGKDPARRSSGPSRDGPDDPGHGADGTPEQAEDRSDTVCSVRIPPPASPSAEATGTADTPAETPLEARETAPAGDGAGKPSPTRPTAARSASFGC